MGKLYLIVLDAYSKWTEVIAMCCTNAEDTITELQHTFEIRGIPEQVVHTRVTCDR